MFREKKTRQAREKEKEAAAAVQTEIAMICSRDVHCARSPFLWMFECWKKNCWTNKLTCVRNISFSFSNNFLFTCSRSFVCLFLFGVFSVCFYTERNKKKLNWMTPIRGSHSMAMTFFWVSFHNSFMNYDVCWHVIAHIHFEIGCCRLVVFNFFSLSLSFALRFICSLGAAVRPALSDKHLTTGNLKVTPIKITNWKLFKWVMKLHYMKLSKRIIQIQNFF